jgi:hypothetical protein
VRVQHRPPLSPPNPLSPESFHNQD